MYNPSDQSKRLRSFVRKIKKESNTNFELISRSQVIKQRHQRGGQTHKNHCTENIFLNAQQQQQQQKQQQIFITNQFFFLSFVHVPNWIYEDVFLRFAILFFFFQVYFLFFFYFTFFLILKQFALVFFLSFNG